MPITATYTPAQLKLTILGTVPRDVIFVSRDAGGTLLVNDGAVAIAGGPATVANTTSVTIYGDLGNDQFGFIETNGALPGAVIYAGGGPDSVGGGSGADTLLGEGDDDTMVGYGGTDVLYGGTGNDYLTGRDGNDNMRGEDGDDTMSWLPGDDNDIMEGGPGSDTAAIYAGDEAETFTIAPNGGRVSFNRTGADPFTVDIGTTEKLEFYGRGGDDTITATGNVAPLISLFLDGQTGNDTILGGNGVDEILGGEGDDFVDGNQSDDLVLLWTGNDTFQWDPGDGNDVVEGEAGTDQLVFNGGAFEETFGLSRNGARMLMQRDTGNVMTDLDGVETFVINALGGADFANIGDLAGSDAGQVIVNLAGTIGGSTADAQIDTVTLNGSAANDTVTVAGSLGALVVSGLQATVQVNHGGATDKLVIQGGGGNDSISGATITAGTINLSLVGGSGNDTLRAGGGNNAIDGGDGNDVLDGGAQIDAMTGGTGDDWFYVDDWADTVIEGAADGANDRILTSVTYTLGAGVYVERLTTTDNAGTASLVLTGNALANLIYGNAGHNLLIGMAGADTLVGLGGNDTYHVDNAADAVSEGASEGALDQIKASVSYVLAAGVYVELLGTIDGAATTAINLTGNEIANLMSGNAGANVLDGSGGADSMYGQAGDDWFHVDDAADVVVEGAGGGANDRIFARVSYVQGAGVQVERLTTNDNAATTAINLTGNELANIIYGNAGANVLDGKAGADTLVGLGGDDWFFVDNAADAVSEGAGGGANDRIFASVSYVQGAGVQVERLTTVDNAATTAINLTGNELANVIYGNAGANVLDGKAGADTLVGLAGDDWFHVDNAADAVSEGAGGGANDRIFASVSYTLGAGVQVERLTTSDNNATTAIDLTGNELANLVYGNAGANVLDGKGGADTLNGMAGADTFRFTTALGAGNVDGIGDYSVADDTIQLDDAVFAGLAAGALAAGAFNTGSAASQADDRIIYDSATGVLLFDADGVGGAAGVQFATLRAGLAMAASEFFVI